MKAVKISVRAHAVSKSSVQMEDVARKCVKITEANIACSRVIVVATTTNQQESAQNVNQKSSAN